MKPENTSLSLVSILRKVKIFDHIPDSILDYLSGKMVISHFKTLDPIFIKGDIGNCIYVIVSGRVKLHEQEMTITEMGMGDFFGEFSLLDNEPRSLSVTAIEPSQLAALHRDDFYLILKEHPDTIKDIIEALIKRIKEQNNKIFSYLKNREKELEAEVNKKTTDLQINNHQLSITLEKLKQTQQQLVFKETLASLGQLTAGIAHTLKNPLNFVNNFSLLSHDMILEILNTKDAKEQEELLQNLQTTIDKVYQHGKRANSIVDNMLQHNSEGSGELQPVNVNSLVDEMADIAYQQYQVSVPDFTCELIRQFQENLPELVISLRDLSRVMLNLFDNAFYAVDQRKKATTDSSYKPKVEVLTKLNGNQFEIIIRDNGSGIPDEIREKIFEPFFTTKPSSYGNGLGLSMSNELVKLYGGEIRIGPTSGQGAEFRIFLTSQA